MPSASELAAAANGMQSVLDAGIEQLSDKQSLTFTLYNRAVVSDDGSVFWVKTATTMSAVGSLHISTDGTQNADETLGMNHAIFTSEALITEFDTMSPGTMWIALWQLPTATLQIAFSSRGRFYQQAKLWHYSGYAIFPAMQSQIINTIGDLPTGPIVSNSLPIWLSQTTFGTTTVAVYPSYLLPDNLVPPYVVAHVEPAQTSALASFPSFDWSQAVIQPTAGAVQLTTEAGLVLLSDAQRPIQIEGISPLYNVPGEQICRDEVTLTLYGFTNALAWQYLSNLISYSNTGPDQAPTFGFANSPVIRDEKRTQTEIVALAMKKTIHISANYYQSAANAVAYRLILSASISSFTVPSPPLP